MLNPLLLRPTILDINLDALVHNARTIQNYVAPAKLLAVVKANAYGHGLIPCVRALNEAGISQFGVALVEEGIRLREAGITDPILVFGGIPGSQIDLYLHHQLDLTASSIAKLDAIAAAVKRLNLPARVHLKIDTGMNRIGVRPTSAANLIAHATALPGIEVVSVYSHCADAEAPDQLLLKHQLNDFLRASAAAPGLRHLANSAALLSNRATHLDMVRPGLALYGIPPAPHLAQVLDLKPVMSIRSQVVFFKVVAAGQGVSYGHRWHAPHDTRIVTVPIGYGDGYLRALSSRSSVLIRGKRYPVVGSICMDQLMVNIGHDEAFNGEEVVLLGSQGQEQISANELATWADTVPHEILTATNQRIPRRYTSKGQQFLE